MKFTSVCAAVLAATLLMGGCAGSPIISGFPIFNTRVVRVGETVEIRIPTDAQGQRRWRVTEFDSAYLMAVGRSDVGGPPANGEVVFLARARREGETSIRFSEVLTATEAAAGRVAGSSSVTVRIVR